MKTVWEGYYLDGRTSMRKHATIQLKMQGLQITTEGGTEFSWSYKEIRQTLGFYPGEQVRLERGTEFSEVLTVSDWAFLSALHQIAPTQTSHIYDPARRRMRANLTFLAGLAIIGFVTVQYFWGIPGLATLLAPFVPVSWEERLGRAMMDRLAPEKDQCVDPYRFRLINDIATTLIGSMPSTSYKFQVVVVNNWTVNALAAPGGYVVVYRGMLEETRTPEELAAVLAHELQHILLRHVTKTILEHASMGLLLAALTGDPTGALTYGLEGARTLGMLHYSRHHEEQADLEGMRMLVAAGVDPGEMVTFYNRMLERGLDAPGYWVYLSTHPQMKERVEKLRALARQMPGRGVKLLPYLDWRSVTTICQVAGYK